MKTIELELSTKFLQLQSRIQKRLIFFKEKNERILKMYFKASIDVDNCKEIGRDFERIRIDLYLGDLSIFTCWSEDITDKITCVYQYMDTIMYKIFMDYILDYFIEDTENKFTIKQDEK